jgi:hypothetical protein
MLDVRILSLSHISTYLLKHGQLLFNQKEVTENVESSMCVILITRRSLKI